jgi:glutathione peroxidase-family protein
MSKISAGISTAKMFLSKKPEKKTVASDIYAHKVTLLDGTDLDLETLRGHPTLIVNTASKCGLTPQYEGLQSLYDTYKDQGLQILGSPSADFADQEFHEADEIGAFCQKNYGVSFPLTELTSVRQEPNELWQDLTTQPNAEVPAWNFTKYLVGADGTLLKHFGPRVEPKDPQVVAAIESALA